MKVALKDLVLSVGTHKDSRPLSPLEVAEGLVELTNEVGFAGALERLTLDVSTARRFLRLRELEPAVGELVDWGRKPGVISFSVAAEITRLSAEEQKQLADACIAFAFTKDETRQIVQLVHRRGDSVADAVNSTLRMRPTVVTIHVAVCAVRAELADSLGQVSQRERDNLLGAAVSSASTTVRPGRLTRTNFSVTSDSPLSDDDVLEIERAVNGYLSELFA